MSSGGTTSCTLDCGQHGKLSNATSCGCVCDSGWQTDPAQDVFSINYCGLQQSRVNDIYNPSTNVASTKVSADTIGAAGWAVLVTLLLLCICLSAVCFRCGRRFVSWRDERRERLRSETWDDDDDGNDRRRKAKKARRRRKKRSPTLTDSEPRRARIPRRSSVISVSGVGVDAQQEVDGEETETDTDDDNDNEQIADGMRTLEGAEDGGHHGGARGGHISSHRLDKGEIEPAEPPPAWKYFQGFTSRRRSSLGLSAMLAASGSGPMLPAGAGDGPGAQGAGSSTFEGWSSPWKQQQPTKKGRLGAAGGPIPEGTPEGVPAVAPPPHSYYPGWRAAGSDAMAGRVYPGGPMGAAAASATSSGSSSIIGSVGGPLAATFGSSAVSIDILRGSSSDEDGLPRFGGGTNKQAELLAPIAPPTSGGSRAKDGPAGGPDGGATATAPPSAFGSQQQLSGRRRSSSWFNLAFGHWGSALFRGASETELKPPVDVILMPIDATRSGRDAATPVTSSDATQILINPLNNDAPPPTPPPQPAAPAGSSYDMAYQQPGAQGNTPYPAVIPLPAAGGAAPQLLPKPSSFRMPPPLPTSVSSSRGEILLQYASPSRLSGPPSSHVLRSAPGTPRSDDGSPQAEPPTTRTPRTSLTRREALHHLIATTPETPPAAGDEDESPKAQTQRSGGPQIGSPFLIARLSGVVAAHRTTSGGGKRISTSSSSSGGHHDVPVLSLTESNNGAPTADDAEAAAAATAAAEDSDSKK